MHSLRRTLLKSIAASAMATKLGAVMAQQNLLRMIVPLTPGTTPDLIGRAIGPAMQSKLGMNYMVDNRPGASGMIGMNYIAKSTDPGALMIVPATTLTLPMFYKKVDFDVINGFTPITQVSSTSFVLVVHKDIPAKNLGQYIAWAKSAKNNFYASPGVGTHHHLCMLVLQQTVGISLEHVPYKGSSQAFTDLVGGQIPTMFMPIQVAVSLAKGGQLKIIGGSLRYRHPSFPDIPTLQEQGAAGYHVDPWYAIWGPPKMPPALVAKYHGAIVAALADPVARESLIKEGLILKTGTPDELLAMAKTETAMWQRVTQAANVKPE
jgi:tripartite-type tricarboxylate transporter receptor subunit TctC